VGRKWWTLIAVSVATFMLLLDITVVNVALPAIREDLGAGFTDLQWVVDAYAVSLAALVLSVGSLADRLGRRSVFAAGLGVFSVASLLCALAPDPVFLNLSRALQGAGGAAMFATSLSLIALEFPAGRERGAAMGVYGATIGSAVAVGPLVGGTLTDSLGWESIFYLNVPIGVAAIVVTYTRLRESRDPRPTRVDWPGAAAFSGALFLLVLALLRGNDEGWGSGPIVALFAGAAALLAAFITIELRVGQPMLPLALFRNPAFTGVQVAAFAVSCSILAQFLYLTLYLQNHLGHPPFGTGLRYLPITLAAFVVAPIAGLLLPRLPARVMISAGLVAVGGGQLLMSGIDASSDWTTLLGGFLVAGAGIGLLNPAIADVAISVVPEEQSGMAAGINDTFRQVGVAVGTAAWGAILVDRGADKIRDLTAGTPAAHEDAPRELVEAASTGSLSQAIAATPPPAQAAVADAAGHGFLTGLNGILLLGAALSLVGARTSGPTSTWSLPECACARPSRATGTRPSPAPRCRARTWPARQLCTNPRTRPRRRQRCRRHSRTRAPSTGPATPTTPRNRSSTSAPSDWTRPHSDQPLPRS
jgi:EmrB/QacA subfamily drug resistance transporter